MRLSGADVAADGDAAVEDDDGGGSISLLAASADGVRYLSAKSFHLS